MLGVISDQQLRVAQTDTAELRSYLRVNEQPVTADQIISVQFIVQKPDGTSSSTPGTVESDGAGFLRWTDTTEEGEYRVQAQFTLVTGEIRSDLLNFSVYDPFNPPTPTAQEIVAEQVLLRLEDCFDSADGGPWLKQETLAHFDATKVIDFIPEALLDINVQMPPSNYDISTFINSDPTNVNPNEPLLVKGVLVLTIRHLMRSYTEQPTPQGGQIVWHDRTRYQQAWGSIYQIEYADYIQAVRLWKRTALRLGSSALLTFSKAGRLYPYGSMRSRGIWRGYY